MISVQTPQANHPVMCKSPVTNWNPMVGCIHFQVTKISTPMGIKIKGTYRYRTETSRGNIYQFWVQCSPFCWLISLYYFFSYFETQIHSQDDFFHDCNIVTTNDAHTSSFASTGGKEHFCVYISCKSLEIGLSCISAGHMTPPELETMARGPQDAAWLQPIRAHSCFGARSQFTLKHIDVFRAR